MANKIGIFLKKKLLGKDQNLISIDEPYLKLSKLLKTHKITDIIDAGASDGSVSRRLLKHFPNASVYAFEPNPLYSKRLEDYAKAESRFFPQFMALSDKDGFAELNITNSAGNTSLLQPDEGFNDIDSQGAKIDKIEKVPVVTIDNWSKNNENKPIQIIKFDIQGYELTALKGAVKTIANSLLAVYTEVWFNSVYAGGAVYSDLDNFLRPFGFVVYDIYKPKYNKKGMLQWANALFVKKDVLG